MRVVVTGGAGFIGGHLVRRLTDGGHEVAVVDDLSTGRRENLPAGVPLAVLDIGATDALATALAGADAVAHLAAVASVRRAYDEPLTVHAINATGTLSVLEACRAANVGTVVFASSAAIYAPSDAPVPESGAIAPSSLYGVDKLAGEGYMDVYAHLHGLRTVSLRYFNVYGPGQLPSAGDSPVVARWMASLAAGDALELHGDGGQTRDFTYVGDIAAATALALAAAADGRASGAFNVGRGGSVSLRRLAEDLAAVAGAPARFRHEPSRPGDVRHSRADVARARAILGYAPSVDLAEGLAATWAWWAARGRAAS